MHLISPYNFQPNLKVLAQNERRLRFYQNPIAVVATKKLSI